MSSQQIVLHRSAFDEALYNIFTNEPQVLLFFVGWVFAAFLGLLIIDYIKITINNFHRRRYVNTYTGLFKTHPPALYVYTRNFVLVVLYFITTLVLIKLSNIFVQYVIIDAMGFLIRMIF